MPSGQIILVEDNQLVAADLADNVRDLGYKVLGTVESGEAAIRLARELKPDLILMDIALGGSMDGVTAARQIWDAQQIPIVFLTAYGDRKTIERTSASGAYAHLTKPVRKEELGASISIALAQHRASRELLEQKLWLATLVSSIEEGVIAVGENGQVIFMNPQAERLTGWKLPDAYGKSVEQVYSLTLENSCILEQPRIRVAARTGAQFSRERFLLRTAQGEEFPIEEIVSTLERDGRLLGAASMFRDMREALRLEQAQKFETIGVLAGGVAHDFNNLLAVMIGNASLAAETLKEGSRERGFLEEIVKSGRKAADLTSQLLAYAGRGTFRKQTIGLANAVREILDLIRVTIPANITVLLNVPTTCRPSTPT
jgi:PAS domain S-box-containing protein